jgi:hypothetical protein
VAPARSGGGGTGPPVYPGSTPVTDDGRHDSGKVNIDSPLFRLKVAAATFDVEAIPEEAVLAFCRDALSAYGSGALAVSF